MSPPSWMKRRKRRQRKRTGCRLSIFWRLHHLGVTSILDCPLLWGLHHLGISIILGCPLLWTNILGCPLLWVVCCFGLSIALGSPSLWVLHHFGVAPQAKDASHVAPELSAMVVYCQATPFPGLAQALQHPRPYEMSSFSERKARKLIKEAGKGGGMGSGLGTEMRTELLWPLQDTGCGSGLLRWPMGWVGASAQDAQDWWEWGLWWKGHHLGSAIWVQRVRLGSGLGLGLRSGFVVHWDPDSSLGSEVWGQVLGQVLRSRAPMWPPPHPTVPLRPRVHALHLPAAEPCLPFGIEDDLLQLQPPGDVERRLPAG